MSHPAASPPSRGSRRRVMACGRGRDSLAPCDPPSHRGRRQLPRSWRAYPHTSARSPKKPASSRARSCLIPQLALGGFSRLRQDHLYLLEQRPVTIGTMQALELEPLLQLGMADAELAIDRGRALVGKTQTGGAAGVLTKVIRAPVPALALDLVDEEERRDVERAHQ